MDPPSQGPPYSNVRQHLFHSSHLPPPSQLHLPPVSSSRSNINTLPPLNPPNRMTPYRHYSPPLSWPTSLHRTSSSRADILPGSGLLHQNDTPLRSPSTKSNLPDQNQDNSSANNCNNLHRRHHHHPLHHNLKRTAMTTCQRRATSSRNCTRCWRINPSHTWYHGVQTVIALS